MKTSTLKFTVSELARMMGKPAKEVLFLLQGIGVDAKSVDSVLDAGTAQSILTGKTQAPKTLIVRQSSPAPAPAAPPTGTPKPRPERAALKRIKIVDRPEGEEGAAEASAEGAVAEVETTATAATAATPATPATTVPTAATPAAPAPAPEPVAAAPAQEAPAPAQAKAAPKAEAPAPEPVAAAPAPAKAAPKVEAPAPEPVAAAPAQEAPAPAPAKAAPKAEAPAPEPVAAAPAQAAAPAPKPAPHAAPAAPHGHAAPVRRPAGAAAASPRTAGISRPAATAPRAAAPAAPKAPVAPPRPALPGGALGRLMRRASEQPAEPPRTPAPAPAPQPPPSQMEATGSVVARPNAPGISMMKPTAAAPAAPPAGASVSVPAAPAVRGRALVAPPTPQSIRAVRAVSATPAPAPRPAPGGPPPRPGFAPRPGMAGPGMRGPIGRGPTAPAMPPGPPAPGDARRKGAVKPTTAKKDDAKKGAAKKPRTKETSALEENVRDYLGNFQVDTYDDIQQELDADGNPIPRTLSKSAQRRAGKKTIETETGDVVQVRKGAPTGPVFLSEGVTVKELSEKTGLLAKDLVKALISRGILATLNQPLDPKIAIEVARDYGVEAAVVSFEEELELSRQQAASDQSASKAEEAAAAGERVPRAPVVTVMGHVDHGKTSLLDAIRKANVAEGEAGGITQHIGAYRVDVNGRKIVFLDTPGHEAFTLMRARGARATDIVVLVVAADDGVMPQTLEAIDHAKAAKVPLVVAINKIDKPEANPQRVKQALAERGVLVEEFGGEVVSCEISAKKKTGIDQLLEMILLQADLLELKAVADGPARGVVLESRREAGKGTLATVLVQQGTLKVGDIFFAGSAVGRVRAMHDDRGTRLDIAPPATPVEVMGFDDLPDAGDTLQVVEDEQKARQVAGFRSQKEREETFARQERRSLTTLFDRMEKGEAKELPILLKADVHGSEEVLVQTLAKLTTEKVKVLVLRSGVGPISTNDVLLASASEAIIIGFNVRPERNAQDLADKEGVEIRLYSVIYTLTDEIRAAMTGLLDKVTKEVAKGKAEVRMTFKVPGAGTIAGCMVTEGVIPRGAQCRLVRDNHVVYSGKLGSLRRFKDDASEVRQGFECGIGIAGYQDLKNGDVIEAYVLEEVAATL